MTSKAFKVRSAWYTVADVWSDLFVINKIDLSSNMADDDKTFKLHFMVVNVLVKKKSFNRSKLIII